MSLGAQFQEAEMKEQLMQADVLSQQGKWAEAVNLLCTLNQGQPDIGIERKLVDIRLQAHTAQQWLAPIAPWAGEWENYPANGHGIDEIEPAAFNASTLAKGILGRGALLVRGLVPQEITQELKEAIDTTILAREQENQTDTSPWKYVSPHMKGRPSNFGAKDATKRTAVKKGSIWVAESPRIMQRLIELYGELGLRSVLTEYFAEPPVLSAKKWVLRKIAPDAIPADWHQDGRFLGTDFHSVNMWMPLSECGAGADAAGLETIPSAHRKIYETGTQGAAFDWSVGRGLVEGLKQDLPAFEPRFRSGDVLFFDYYNLHRTAFGAHLTEDRYAVESWFFSSSSVPQKLMPILF